VNEHEKNLTPAQQRDAEAQRQLERQKGREAIKETRRLPG